MIYVTHKERRALIYIAAGMAVAMIGLVILAAVTAGTPCSHGPASFDTCAYALR